VAVAVEEHFHWLSTTGALRQRRVRRARDEIEAIALTELRGRWGQLGERSKLDELAGAVAAGERDPYSAADELLG
jgi:LAO/AO transport system kinase